MNGMPAKAHSNLAGPWPRSCAVTGGGEGEGEARPDREDIDHAEEDVLHPHHRPNGVGEEEKIAHEAEDAVPG